MIRIITFFIVPVVFLVISFKTKDNAHCTCNRTATEKIILSKQFNNFGEFDSIKDSRQFYALSKAENRKLWYRDIESPKETAFTSFWNDYAPNNYHASHLDFVKYYEGRKDIELAFQFGPNSDLWAYSIFVIRKVGCCYLATRSYFRHARFTRKRYAIFGEIQLDSLFAVIAQQKVLPIDTAESFDYCGYFRDNRSNKSFYLNFTKDTISVPISIDSSTSIRRIQVSPRIERLFDYVEDSIRWTKTYSL